MVIDLGKAEIFKRQMAQAGDGIVRREFPAAYLLEKFKNGIGVQRSTQQSAVSIQPR